MQMKKMNEDQIFSFDYINPRKTRIQSTLSPVLLSLYGGNLIFMLLFLAVISCLMF